METSRVDKLIDRVMAGHPGLGVTAQAGYYEDVHQHLAPLARELESQNNRMLAALKAVLSAHNSGDLLKLWGLMADARAVVDQVKGK